MPTDTDHPVFDNMNKASKDLNLTEQEQNLYSMHLSNLWGDGGVDNADGSRSTLYQSVEQHDGKYYSIPTVWNGKRETEPYTRDDGKTFDVPNQIALSNVDQVGWDKFPSYDNPDTADQRYGQMHSYMEQDTQNYFNMAGNGN